MRVSCPDCGAHMNADPVLAGKLVRCSVCGRRFQLPDSPDDVGAKETREPKKPDSPGN